MTTAVDITTAVERQAVAHNLYEAQKYLVRALTGAQLVGDSRSADRLAETLVSVDSVREDYGR